MLTILLTGHCGYIGSTLFNHLKSSFNVIGYDRINGDNILDYDKLLKIFTTNKIDLVIHLAAMSTVSECNDHPIQASIVNSIGTRNLLTAMTFGNCKNIIYTSTCSVYGSNSVLPYTENMMPSPCSVYGESKLAGENHIRKAAEKEEIENYIIFRLFNVIGDYKNKVNTNQDRLFTALLSGDVTIYGNDYPTEDGTCERDYISLQDTCNAYNTAAIYIQQGNSIQRTINICSGVLTSVEKIVTIWNNVCTQETLPTVRKMYGERRSGDPPKVYGSNEVAYKLLHWKPKQTIETVISTIILENSSKVEIL